MAQVRKMISLSKDVIKMGLERACQFRMPFSQYLAWLIKEDYRSGKRTITITADETPEYRKFRENQARDERQKD